MSSIVGCRASLAAFGPSRPARRHRARMPGRAGRRVDLVEPTLDLPQQKPLARAGLGLDQADTRDRAGGPANPAGQGAQGLRKGIQARSGAGRDGALRRSYPAESPMSRRTHRRGHEPSAYEVRTNLPGVIEDDTLPRVARTPALRGQTQGSGPQARRTKGEPDRGTTRSCDRSAIDARAAEARTSGAAVAAPG